MEANSIGSPSKTLSEVYCLFLVKCVCKTTKGVSYAYRVTDASGTLSSSAVPAITTTVILLA